MTKLHQSLHIMIMTPENNTDNQIILIPFLLLLNSS